MISGFWNACVYVLWSFPCSLIAYIRQNESEDALVNPSEFNPFKERNKCILLWTELFTSLLTLCDTLGELGCIYMCTMTYFWNFNYTGIECIIRTPPISMTLRMRILSRKHLGYVSRARGHFLGLAKHNGEKLQLVFVWFVSFSEHATHTYPSLHHYCGHQCVRSTEEETDY